MRMPSGNADDSARESQLRQACAELERRLRAGQECRAEDLFTAYPALAVEVDSALDLIWTEIDTRQQLGQSQSREVILRRFPQWREQLKGLLDELEEVSREAFTANPKLKDYEPIQLLGSGPMAEVWRVRPRLLDHDVVVKMFAGGDAHDLARFRRGAQDQARLKHPNIVPVHEVGESFFAMEWGEGGGLDRKIAGEPQPGEQAARCVETLARAMHYAHGQGIIHRDLKPANVVLTAAGVPKITDFGLAKHLDGKSGPTQSGALIGTLAYMAPEQVSGRKAAVDRRTDVYGLGMILYEMLTGRVPFPARSPLELLRQVQHRVPEHPRRFNRALDHRLGSVCLQCLEKKQRHRYRTAEGLAEDLTRWQNGRRPLAHGRLRRVGRTMRRHRLASAVALVIACAAVIVPLVLYLIDPERAREGIEGELRSGRTATLIGETGPPRWCRWATEEETQQARTAADGSFSMSCDHVGLLELVQDPQHASYRFSAEVRTDHVPQAVEGVVGIYFAYSKHTTKWGVEHCYCYVAIDGLWDHRRMDPRLKGNEVALTLARHIAQTAGERRSPAGRQNMFLQVNQGEIVWRQIAVVVSPEKTLFTIWRESESPQKSESREVTRKELEDVKAKARVFIPELPPADGLPVPLEVDPALASQSPLGLYVRGARASFRNVTITPFPSKN
jgi:hypothetical protein